MYIYTRYVYLPLLLLTGSTAHVIRQSNREKMSELTAAVPQALKSLRYSDKLH